MTRSSRSVRRAVSILNFFADHPGSAFTLNELAEALGLSRTACHACLSEFTKSGYLYQPRAGAYWMGPALVSIGVRAQEELPLHTAHPEMRALAEDFDVICSAIGREGDECIVRSRVDAPSHGGWSSPQGTRMLLRAPFAATYYAWSPEAETNAWLAQTIPMPSAGEMRDMSEAMRFARAHGFCFYIRKPGDSDPRAAAEVVFARNRREFPVAMLSDLNQRNEYCLNSIVAPVFDSHHRVTLVLGLMGFLGTFAGSHIERMGRSLREACDRITASLATAVLSGDQDVAISAPSG